MRTRRVEKVLAGLREVAAPEGMDRRVLRAAGAGGRWMGGARVGGSGRVPVFAAFAWRRPGGGGVCGRGGRWVALHGRCLGCIERHGPEVAETGGCGEDGGRFEEPGGECAGAAAFSGEGRFAASEFEGAAERCAGSRGGCAGATGDAGAEPPGAAGAVDRAGEAAC